MAERVAAGATVSVGVRGIAAGGSGVADLPDGRVVFVPRTAPGDTARIRVEKSKARWAVGSLHRLVEAGPDRQEAPCPLYMACGGCHLQHLTYEAQLKVKGRLVADALRRIGGLGEIEAPEVVASPRTTGYRNRVAFTLRRLRDGRVVAGFHGLARPAHVVDVHDECLLPEPEITAAWSALRAGWGLGATLLPGGGRLRLTLRSSTQGVELIVDGGPEGWQSDALGQAVPQLVAIRHRPSKAEESATGSGPSRHSSRRRGPAATAGDGRDRGPGVPEPEGEAQPGLGTAFEQVNREVSAALTAYVMAESAPVGTAGTAVDAYCGIGVFGRGLTELGWTVTGIEVDDAAVGMARDGAPEGFTAVVGRVEEELAGLLPAELVIVNPPRAGLHPDVSAALLAGAPGRIVYVSCDPATLARDLGALSDGYELTSLRAFDLFPQTAHVETVAVLTGRGPA